MKKLSIKLKVTLWFTVLMSIIVIAALCILLVFGSKIVYEQVEVKLEDVVYDSFDEIKYRFGEIDIDDDLDFYNNGVYIAVYTEDEKLLYGRLPSDFDRSIPFSAGEIRTFNENSHTQYVFDVIHNAGKGHNVIVRGVLSASGSEDAFETIMYLAMIMLPIFIIVASTVGYLIARHAFKPVKQIADAAEAINSGNDLTKRIGLRDGNDEIHKLAKNFDLMFDRLETSFENEKRFTSDASHELRTPLTVIIGQCESVLESDNESEIRAALETVLSTSKEMASLVSSLLTLARADRGHLKLLKESFDLSETVEIVCDQAKEIADAKNIKIYTDIENNIFINGDHPMIIRMILNIIENAIKYGKDNGKIEISLYSEHNNALLTVKDDGIGIEKAHIEKVFERFFREDESRNKGSGLGLPLAKYIAEAHGGSISLESESGIGSTFFVRIPT